MPVLQPQPTPPIQGEINTLLGKGSTFEGKLFFEGTVRIDGKLSGEIYSEDVLVVGEGAEVKAKIEVGVLIVEGTIEGNCRASRAIEMHAPARVRGNLETPSLFIDKGVIFEGNCKMEGLAPATGGRGSTPPAGPAAESKPTEGKARPPAGK